MKLYKKIFIPVLLVIIIAFAVHLYERLSFATTKTYYDLKGTRNDTSLSIGIIGDSWVSYHKLDTILQNQLIEKGVIAKIFSSGKDGARTKQIYLSLFNDAAAGFESKSIIEQQPHFCIIIAGVNDAQSFTGSGNYTHHMLLMIKTLLHYKIKPVVVTLPLFDTDKAQKNIGMHRKVRNKVSALITGDSKDNIQQYRKSLEQVVQQEKLTDSIITLNFEKFCEDLQFCNHWYRDALHLNDEGNRRLCELIIRELKIFNPL